MRALILCLLLLPVCGQAADLRECRLDALSFVDPWGGARFDVRRVGTYAFLLCPEGVRPDQPGPVPSECRGRFGSIVLDGQLKDRDDGPGERLLAEYYTMPAAPCCGWELFRPGDKPALEADLTWYAPGSAPVLGTQPFASIESGDYTEISVNPLHALVCAHALDTDEPE
ncbi:hypothetical protein [Pseudoponticoccus marisrubri]|uniref:Uncharacterized protein n=1 Tax=Pseudoponticoccus marisrubri TaxID=1685382 RepID=A0A0W7WJW4_9RHOB|nr:hypothetical protein [Pseudoponticoccus marisrubri]KUF10915.1 hypothetical protein AVJ23_10815 [Pseudoponticoccus marisrubri]